MRRLATATLLSTFLLACALPAQAGLFDKKPEDAAAEAARANLPAATIWVDARKIHLFDPASGENLTMDASRAGTVPGGNMMAKAEEVGQEQDEVQPTSDEPAS